MQPQTTKRGRPPLQTERKKYNLSVADTEKFKQLFTSQQTDEAWRKKIVHAQLDCIKAMLDIYDDKKLLEAIEDCLDIGQEDKK